MSEPRRAAAALIPLLTSTRRDWREREVAQVLRHLETTLRWPWARILAVFPRVAAEPGSRPGDVADAWRCSGAAAGTPPTPEYRAMRQAMNAQVTTLPEGVREGVRQPLREGVRDLSRNPG